MAALPRTARKLTFSYSPGKDPRQPVTRLQLRIEWVPAQPEETPPEPWDVDFAKDRHPPIQKDLLTDTPDKNLQIYVLLLALALRWKLHNREPLKYTDLDGLPGWTGRGLKTGDSRRTTLRKILEKATGLHLLIEKPRGRGELHLHPAIEEVDVADLASATQWIGIDAAAAHSRQKATSCVLRERAS